MIDFTMAEQIAREFINRAELRGTKEPYAIMPERTMTTAHGWVFFYDVETYVQTREESDDQLIGAVPILVEKGDGSVHPLYPEGVPIEVWLAEYEVSRTLPVRRTPVTFLHGQDAEPKSDAHLTLDHQQTLCGQPVPAIPSKGATGAYCPKCWPLARAAGLVCPACEWSVLDATDPDWCWRCRLARRMGLL